MNFQFSSSNSAFQKFTRPFILKQKNEIYEHQDLLQNSFKPSNQAQAVKSKQVSIESYQVESQIDSEFQEQESSRAKNVKDDNQSIAKTLDDHMSGQLKKKRKTKKQIVSNHKDQGRGGNCIASNITKTLLRVIKIKVQNSILKQFHSLIERYKIKSQKQNTIIIILILYVFAKQGKISHSLFDNILAENFFKSLEQSKINCQKKMEEESQRRYFHLKNRKMYNKFIEINTKLFEILAQALENQKSSMLQLDRIEEIISDTYDRKQRQVEKAINKIKSIILNHSQLKELFGYELNDVIQTFKEAVEYAYRRNLPKRCKHTLSKINDFFEEFNKIHNLQTDEEKYFVCYLATKLVGEKQKQIWNEFIENLNMNKKFNTSSIQLEKLTNYLKEYLPEKVFKLEQFATKISPSSDQCKQQDLDSQDLIFYSFYKAYSEIAMRICY